jgi:DNA-binding IclR family transcriptional regulator
MTEELTRVENPNSVRSIGRVIDLLELFDHRTPSMSLRELVERTGLPKTTVVRLLANLESRGLITTLRDGDYTLGGTFLRWGRLASQLWEVDEATHASMRRLVERCGETTNIYVRQDEVRLSIAQHEGTSTVRTVVEVGTPMPLSGGAPAKVLLSAAPDLIDRVCTDPEAMRAEVQTVADRGWALSHGERELGASSVAAPIVRDGRVLAALTISGPTTRFTEERMNTYIEAVTETAKEISGAGLGRVEALL